MTMRAATFAEDDDGGPVRNCETCEITQENAPEFFAAVRAGKLSEYLADEPESGGALLYQIVSDVVYERLTRAIERRRGHWSCLISVYHLEPECHDRHQDDVAAVRADLLLHADRPIDNLQGWLVSRLKAVTIDAYRARRGAIGAQQRPRLPLPRWLDDKLGHDTWLAWLGLGVLSWVGVPVALANGLWPLGAWADRRAEVTGVPCTEAQVAEDVERVLAAMRSNPAWYERYVETPLGHKQAPLLAARSLDPDGASAGDAAARDQSFLPLVDPGERVDGWLREVAAEAIAAVEARIAAGEQLRAAFIAVLNELFVRGIGSEDVGCAPADVPDTAQQVAHVLADPAGVERIADALIEILADRPGVRGT